MSLMQLVTKLLNEDRPDKIHNLIEAHGFRWGPPTIAASSEVAMVPPCANAPSWRDDREDALKVWGFEQATAEIPCSNF